MFNQILDEIKANSMPQTATFAAKILQIHETGYGKGDILLGCPIPIMRNIAKKYNQLVSLQDIERLLQSEIHELRMIALMIMTNRINLKPYENKDKIVDIYLKNTKYINNWDLVDLSCYKILGVYFSSSDDIFQKLADSEDLWEQRIAIVSTYRFIKQDNFKLTLELAEKFLVHKHHLIHKACGWMLREIGKRDINVLLNFLAKHHNHMPRIMLSYAKEKLTIEQKSSFR